MIYRVVDPKTKRETDDERVIAVKEGPLRMEFFHRHVSDGYRTYWQAPVDSVKAMVQELVDYAAKTEGKGGVVGLGIRSEEIKGVSHDSIWRSMMESIREPARFYACSDVSIKECNGFVQRTMTANGETYIENIYSDEPSCELVYRKLVNGSETDVERVVALRTHPLQIEFHGGLCAGGSGQGRRAAHDGRLRHDFRPRPRTHVRLPFRGSGPFHQGAVAGDRRGPGWLLRRGLRRLHPPQDEAPRDR